MFNKFIINKNNLIKNINKIKNENPHSLICAMVKANAYGVGLKQVVKILSPHASFFGVSNVYEANEVQKFCNNKILIVGPLEQKKLNNKFSYTCQSLKEVCFLAKQNKVFNVHLKINTGMNRYGVNSIKQFKLMLKKIKNSKLKLEGVFTHFATQDNYINIQMNVFNKYMQVCKNMGFNPIFHADNSATLNFKNHNLNMVRVGYSLYCSSNHPVVKIKTEIVKINYIKKNELVGYNYRFVAKHKMKIAVVPIGYADGFDLHYIGINLIIKNRPCKVLNICMDCFMLDISKINLKEGNKIEILNNKNTLKRYANYSHSSEYEVLTKFSKLRANRIVK